MSINKVFDKVKKYLIILRYRLWQLLDRDASEYIKSLQIMSMKETLQYIIKHKCSIARYGDGEFIVMGGGSNGFQKNDEKLAERLRQVLADPLPNLLICIPSFIKHVRPFVQNSKLTGLGFNHVYLKSCVMPYLRTNRTYGDSLVTRFYMSWKNKNFVYDHIKLLKQLWNEENVLIVEGEYSRLGVGNDLFDNANSIKRILCPSENAFDKYDEILKTVKEGSDSRLVILALGMTATVLAYDLAKKGIRALDLGHIDIEYEWYRMNASHKIPVANKVIAEVVGGKNVQSSNDIDYLSQIIKRI